MSVTLKMPTRFGGNELLTAVVRSHNTQLPLPKGRSEQTTQGQSANEIRLIWLSVVDEGPGLAQLASKTVFPFC